jgi:hypothetical protein
MKQQNRSVNPASECLDWSPINLSALPLLTEGHQQSAEVLQKLGNGTPFTRLGLRSKDLPWWNEQRFGSLELLVLLFQDKRTYTYFFAIKLHSEVSWKLISGNCFVAYSISQAEAAKKTGLFSLS